MAKKSQRRITRYEKDQAGCMSGLVRIFDFRYRRTTRKLLSNRRHEYRHDVVSTGNEYKNTKSKMLTNPDDKCQKIEGSDGEEVAADDFIKASVKELMEEEMLTDQDSKKHINNGQDSPHGRKNLNRRNKTSMESFDIHMPDSEISCHQITEQKTSKDIDLESIMEELLKIQRSNASYENLDVKSNKSYSLVEENLSAAIQLFMNGKIDLSSDKELFLKLVQDAQLEVESNTKSRIEEHVESKNRSSFFRRRSKSRESNSLTENEKSQPSSRIVILKPGPVAPQKLDDKLKKKKEVKVQEGVGTGSQFSFDNIKKKLKNAMSPVRHIGDQNSGTHKKIKGFDKKFGEESGGWSSPNRNHFFNERFARASFGVKKGEKVPKLRENETNLMNEAKKHLSEMVNKGNEKDDLIKNRIPETLGGILSLPEYKSSPLVDENKWRLIQENPNARVSSSRSSKDEDLDEKVQSLESDASVSDEIGRDNLVDGSMQSNTELRSQGPEEIQKAAEPASQEDREEVLDDEENPSLIARENLGNSQVCEEQVSSQSPKSDSLEEDQSFSSPSVSPPQSSSTRKIEENAVDKTERPSPVSVLEIFIEDDDISPPMAKSLPVDTAIQPVQMRLNDQEICIRTCLVDEESAFEYVEAVLLASDLNWNEYLLRWLSSNPPLDPSLYDEVELFSNRSCHDQKLLFDCTNEVLQEVCERYFGCSFGKNSIRPVPHKMDLINEVWEGVELHLLRDPPPHSLDKLLKNDMAKSKTWLNVQVQKESIVVELKNYILDELVDDTVMGFLLNKEMREKEDENRDKRIS